jgi:phage FluMu protein Com
MIQFSCKKCGQKITMPQVHAGKKGKCPKCKQIVTIPEPTVPETKAKNNDTKSPGVKLDISLKEQNLDRSIDEEEIPESVVQNRIDIEPLEKRKLPWLIDIFLYPISVPGLTMLGIFIFMPIVLGLILSFLARALGALGPRMVFGLLPLAILFAIIRFIVSWYMIWYFGVCVQESAAGQIRAPETLTKGGGFDIVEMFFQSIRFLCCIVICFGPVLAYYFTYKQAGRSFWLILTGGIFFFPMTLLSTVMFDSIIGLNPILIVTSIFSTFFQYCCVVVMFCIPVGIIAGMLIYLPKDTSFLIQLILRTVYAYQLLIAGHLLGDFFKRNEERLYWEV